ADFGPQIARSIAEVAVELDPDRALDALATEDGESRGVEAACADGGVGEADRAKVVVRDRADITRDGDGESIRRRELPETVPLRGRLSGIERRLNAFTALFHRLFRPFHRRYSPSFASSSNVSPLGSNTLRRSHARSEARQPPR